MSLIAADVGQSSHANAVATSFVISRRAEDLSIDGNGTGAVAIGKAELNCPQRTIYVWSMAQNVCKGATSMLTVARRR